MDWLVYSVGEMQHIAADPFSAEYVGVTVKHHCRLSRRERPPNEIVRESWRSMVGMTLRWAVYKYDTEGVSKNRI